MIANQTLKNAARAIEHDLWTDTSGANYLVKDWAILRRWEPETSSADSFELMVALGIKVRWHSALNQALAWILMDEEIQVNAEDFGGDRFIATRAAVILAAAHIGAAL